MAEYKLGNFTFTTEEEYQKALKEAKTVKLISERYDVNDPSKAKVILSKFKAETSVGEAFRRKLKSTCEQAELEAKLFDEIDSEMEKSERIASEPNHINRTAPPPRNNRTRESDSFAGDDRKTSSNSSTAYTRKTSNEDFKPTGSFNVSVDAGGITVADRYYGYKELAKVSFQKVTADAANVDLTLKNASHVVFLISFRTGVFVYLNRAAFDNGIPIINKGCPEIIQKNGRLNIAGFAKVLMSKKDVIISIILSAILAFILDIVVVAWTRTKVDAFQTVNAWLAVGFGFLVFLFVQDISNGSGSPGNAFVLGIILGAASILLVGVILYVIIMGMGLEHINLSVEIAYTIIISLMVIMSNMMKKLTQLAKELVNV